MFCLPQGLRTDFDRVSWKQDYDQNIKDIYEIRLQTDFDRVSWKRLWCSDGYITSVGDVYKPISIGLVGNLFDFRTIKLRTLGVYEPISIGLVGNLPLRIEKPI